MNRSPLAYAIVLTLLFIIPAVSFAQAEKTFNTKYTVIHYTEDKDISDFVWRLGGQRLELKTDSALVSYRIDRIIERVETILDMRPAKLKINVYLQRGALEPNKIAFYEYKTKSIHVSVDRVTDGVFAHEIAHAIINQGFGSPLPSKMQEILTQYVDKYLWNDY